MTQPPIPVRLAPCWSRPDANELRARRARLTASAMSGPYKPKPLRIWHRIHRALAWVFGGQGR